MQDMKRAPLSPSRQASPFLVAIPRNKLHVVAYLFSMVDERNEEWPLVEPPEGCRTAGAVIHPVAAVGTQEVAL